MEGGLCAGGSGVLHHALYVALTRARSILWVSGANDGAGESGNRILKALQESWEDQRERMETVEAETRVERIEGLISEVGPENEQWLRDLASKHQIHEEPITSPEGAILAEPLFWIVKDSVTWVCFGKSAPTTAVRDCLEDMGFRILPLGGSV